SPGRNRIRPVRSRLHRRHAPGPAPTRRLPVRCWAGVWRHRRRAARWRLRRGSRGFFGRVVAYHSCRHRRRGRQPVLWEATPALAMLDSTPARIEGATGLDIGYFLKLMAEKSASDMFLTTG